MMCHGSLTRGVHRHEVRKRKQRLSEEKQDVEGEPAECTPLQTARRYYSAVYH